MAADLALSADLGNAPSFTLGHVQILPASCEIIAGDRREHVEKRVMQVLVVLASPPRRVVSRDKLIDVCWSGRSVTDDAIARCIVQLRRLAREFGGFQIETLVGLGYRLIEDLADGPGDLAPTYRLNLIGAFRLLTPDGTRIPVPSRKGAALIAVLAMSKEGERNRSWLRDKLWGTRPATQGNASLRRELASLRRDLNHAAALLICEGDLVRLDLARITVDAREPDSAAGDTLLTQDFLEGLDLQGEPGFESWLRDQRHTLRPGASEASTRVESAAAASRPDRPRLPDKPSIAVAPFVNLSGDPEDDYFAEGMAEDIVGALARFKSIVVMAAGPTIDANGAMLPPIEAARQRGVRYLLDGSIRKFSGRIRVAVRLKEADTGAAVWTDRLDGDADDIFGLQDLMALRVAGAVETTLQDVDVYKAVARPTANMGSYDLYLRSLPHFRAFTRDDILTSVDYLDRAIALDNRFALALSQSGVCHRLLLEHGWAKDREACRTRGLHLVDEALRFDSGDAKVLAQCAASRAGLEDNLHSAMALIGRAIAINPSSSFVWLISGTLHLRAGESDIASEHLERAMHLDPISGMNRFHRMYLAAARFQQGRFEDALELFRTTELRIPISHAMLAAIYGHLGQPRPARAALAEFRNLVAGGADDIARVWFARPEHRTLFMDGIALAEQYEPEAPDIPAH